MAYTSIRVSEETLDKLKKYLGTNHCLVIEDVIKLLLKNTEASE